MGIYYYAVDVGHKKYFSAPDDYAIKSPGCFYPGNPFPSMLVMKNIQGYSFDIWDDCGHDIPPSEGYKDVTEEVFEELKNLFPEYKWNAGD